MDVLWLLGNHRGKMDVLWLLGNHRGKMDVLRVLGNHKSYGRENPTRNVGMVF